MRFDRPSLTLLLAILFAAAMGARPAAAQMPPDSTGAIFARVATDKPVYAPGEPIQIQVFAINASPDTARLFFSSSCQADYVIDGQYRYLDHAACLTVLTGRTLAPGETQLIHTFTHQASDYQLGPGPHWIEGEVLGYARNQVQIQVRDSMPPPPGGMFEVRGAVEPSRGPIGADRNLSCTVTNVGDTTGVFGVDGCPVDWSIDGAYRPNRACPEFYRQVELAPGQSITFGPDDPGMLFSPHDFPLGPGTHFVVMDVRGAGSDTVAFGVQDPDPDLTALAGRIFESAGRPAHTGFVYLTAVSADSTPAPLGPPPTTEVHQVRIGGQGWFLFAGIRPGAYLLHAELPEEDPAGNFAARVIWWPGTADPSQAQPLDLAPGAYRDGIRLTFGSAPPPPQFFLITGAVNQISAIPEGSPLAGAVVMAVPAGGVFPDSIPPPGANGETDPAGPGPGGRFVGYTGNDGRFTIKVPAGNYRLVAGELGRHRYQYWNHADRFEGATVLPVPDPRMHPTLEPRFDLAPLANASVATITGIVMNDDPNLDRPTIPVEGATVMAVPILPSMVARLAPQRTVTGPDGRYVLNVPADTPYILSAEAPGMDRVYYRNFPDPYSADWVDVAPEDTTAHIDFTLRGSYPPGNTATIEGMVYRVLPEADCVGPIGNDCSIPAEGAVVHIVPAYPTFAPYEVRAKVGPDGRFRATGITAGPDGSLSYYVSAEYPGYELAYYPGGVPFPEARPLVVYPNRAADAGIILLGRTSTPPTGGFLAGRIVDPDGHGVDHARVRAFLDPESAGGRVAGGYTDANGNFMVQGLPAGASVLMAVDAEGFIPAYYPGAHRWQQAERVVTGGPNLRVAEVVMTLRPAMSGGRFLQAGRVRIAGAVTPDDTTFSDPGVLALAWHQENLPGAFFYLVNPLSASPIEIPVSGGVSAENGAVILTGLSQGTYTAYADRPGYESAAYRAEGDAGITLIRLDDATPAVLADIRLQPVGGTAPGTRNGDASGPVVTLVNAPNPFRPQTVIRFELSEECPVGLQIYDYRGRLVRTLLSGGNQTSGIHEIPWNGTDDAGRRVSAGVYFYRVMAMGHATSRKMVLLP